MIRGPLLQAGAVRRISGIGATEPSWLSMQSITGVTENRNSQVLALRGMSEPG